MEREQGLLQLLLGLLMGLLQGLLLVLLGHLKLRQVSGSLQLQDLQDINKLLAP